MRIVALFIFTFSLLGNFGRCDTKFITPRDWRDDERNRRNPEMNRRYVVGEEIPLDWKTDEKDSYSHLLVVQPEGSVSPYWPISKYRSSWEAVYDKKGRLENGEDSVYYFAIYDFDLTKQLAASLYFNVTAPKKDKTRTVTAPTSYVTVSYIGSIETEPTSTTISTTTEEKVLPTKQQESQSKSEMTQGEVAGAAVGGVIGGCLIFGTIGWVLWRRLVRRKTEPVDTAAVQYQEQVVETKAELPGDNRVHPSEYAKSPTGIYEAP